jgi:malate dehydrogenase
VSIIGAGKVGSTAAQLLAYKGFCDIVLVNRTAEVAEGIALDIKESSAIEEFDVDIVGTGDYSEISGSDVVAITAGQQRKEGMSRDDLLMVNAGIVAAAAEQVREHAPGSKLIVVTNPLDEMVYLASKKTGFQKQRIMGMAGVLDSCRFRNFIAAELKVSASDVSVLVLGSHGDLMLPLPRYASVGGIPLEQLMSADRIASIVERTRNAGAEIIALEKNSSAFYAPASSLVLMIESMVKNKRMTLPCSAYLNGEYGIEGIFIGVPVVLGSNGIERVVELELNASEREAFQASAKKIKASVSQLDKLGV